MRVTSSFLLALPLVLTVCAVESPVKLKEIRNPDEQKKKCSGDDPIGLALGCPCGGVLDGCRRAVGDGKGDNQALVCAQDLIWLPGLKLSSWVCARTDVCCTSTIGGLKRFNCHAPNMDVNSVCMPPKERMVLNREVMTPLN